MTKGDNAFGYAALERRFRELGDLAHAQAMLGWDEAVMMPSGGGERRGDVLATLAGVVHRQLTSPDVADLIAAAAEETGLDTWQRANLREIRRRHLHATALPETLVVARSRQGTRCEQIWRSARAANDWRAIEAPLAELVRLTREMAVDLGAATHLAPYDALIDQYQPGMDQAQIDPIFAELRGFLPGFVDQVL